MQQESNDPGKLKNENEILKIKLMLEHGADFSGGLDGIDPKIENQFLKNIDEYERKFSNCKRISVYEKIQSPVHFKPVEEIKKKDISPAWLELIAYMNKHGVTLDVCSPHVSEYEMYRFVTEELFKEQIDDIDIKGMMCSFIYDEFYPDHKYENTRVAIENCMQAILSKTPFEWLYDFEEAGLQLNRHRGLSILEFKERVMNFKSAYNTIDVLKLKEFDCTIEQNTCHVNGLYKMNVLLDKDLLCMEGDWMVQFKLDERTSWWKIVNVQIGGLNI